MPAIKKKWIKANQEGLEETENNEVGLGDEERESPSNKSSIVHNVPDNPVRAKKRSSESAQGMLRGLDGEVLLQKRKRFVPPAESKLSEWLDEHLEKKDNVKVSLVQLYKLYTNVCQGDSSDVLDIPPFNRMIKTKFGQSFGVKDSSVLKAVLKERRLDEPKKKASEGPRLKDIAHEAIKYFGNPWNGVRFFSLKQYVGSKYPMLRIDQRPKVLKRILEIGVGTGQVELVKGIGMAGFYRLQGAEPPKPKLKQEKKEETDAKDDSKEADSAGSDAQEPKEKSDSAETGDQDAKENKEDNPEKPKKPKKITKCDLKRVPHGNPQKIEDTFPLAITFQSAPKVAKISRIRRYIQENYKENISDIKWRNAISHGVEAGHWEYHSGSGVIGDLHLLMDDFDPDSSNHQDQICAGIIACHEPKAASGNVIKKYISRYHPDFGVDERPDRFKKALIRAAEKSMINQVSGLGANGSFELCDKFVPTPRVLSGEDPTTSEEEEENSDEEPLYIPKGTKSRGIIKKKESSTTHNIVKRPAPRSRQPPALVGRQNEKRPVVTKNRAASKISPGKNNKKSKGKKRGGGFSDPLSSDEEEEEEEMIEYTPRQSKSRSRPGRTPAFPVGNKSSKKSSRSSKPVKQNKRVRSPAEYDDDDDDGEDEEVEYTPRKSQSRGGTPKNSTPIPRKSGSNHKAGKSPKLIIKKLETKSSSGKTISTLQISENSDGADEDSEPEVTPKKSSSKSRPAKSIVSPKAKKNKKKGRKRY